MDYLVLVLVEWHSPKRSLPMPPFFWSCFLLSLGFLSGEVLFVVGMCACVFFFFPSEGGSALASSRAACCLQESLTTCHAQASSMYHACEARGSKRQETGALDQIPRTIRYFFRNLSCTCASRSCFCFSILCLLSPPFSRIPSLRLIRECRYPSQREGGR